MNLTVCGINWGDEGKGRFVDYLSGQFDVVCRYQGGNNAGHTVVNEYGEFKLHLIPSGVFYKDTINYLGPGILLNMQALIEEFDSLEARGISWARDNFKISDRTPLCLKLHVNEDTWEEERLLDQAYGSTRNGIAPGYADKYLKKSLLLGELENREACINKLEALLTSKNICAKALYGKEHDINVESYVDALIGQYSQIKAMVVNTQEFERSIRSKSVLFEAQLGALRDVTFGIYPFVSSSNVLADNAGVGSGLFSHARSSRVLGVMKSFSTCVGAGPFVTEMQEDNQ